MHVPARDARALPLGSRLPLDASLPRAEVGAWLSEREARWDAVEDAEYRRCRWTMRSSIRSTRRRVNRALRAAGSVYGAGVGRFGKPQFFLGALEREEWRDGVRILVARREYARDLAPAPAALRDDTIYVRLDSLQRVLWERAEVWERRRRATAR